MWKTLYAVLSASSLSQLHCAHALPESIQEVLWNEPDGYLPDLSQTFIAGQTVGVSWNEYNGTAYVDTTDNLVDLWVTYFNYSLDAFNQRLLENINLTQPGNTEWNIAIPDISLEMIATYALRFKLPSSIFDSSTGDLSSPGFLVVRAAPLSATSSSPTSTTPGSSSSSSSSSSSDISIQTILPVDTPGVASSGLSGGAKAGIAIGVVVVLLLSIGIRAYFISKRKHAAAQNSSRKKSDTRPGQGRNTHAGVPSELPSDGRWPPSELPVG